MRLSTNRTSSWIARAVLALVICLVCGSAQDARAADNEVLMVASSKDHVWFVAKDPSRPRTWRLMHHTQEMGGPYARVARTLDSKPLAIAARGDQVLVAMRRTVPGAGDLDLLGLRVEHNAAMGTFFDMPLDGWNVLAGIPNDAPLAGIAIGTEGPLALLLPEKRVLEGIRRTSASAETPPQMARLLLQKGFAWNPIELPEGLTSSANQRLCPTTGLAEALVLGRGADGSAQVHSFADEAWSQKDLGVQEELILRIVRYQDRLAYVLKNEGSTIKIAFERGESLLTVATVPKPSITWGLAASGDQLLLIEIDNGGKIGVRSIDSIQGTLGSYVQWIRPPLDVSEWLHLPIIGMVVVAALLAIVLFRPSESPDAPLRAGIVPMPFSRRFIALLIDLVPGIVLALIFFDTDLSLLSSMPLWSSEFALAGPGAVVIGVTILHETVAELIWRRSLGKFVMGGVVRASDGSQPSSSQILLRALFKAVVLYAPILAVFVFLSPALQGVPETVSRTVVADARVRENPSDPE